MLLRHKQGKAAGEQETVRETKGGNEEGPELPGGKTVEESIPLHLLKWPLYPFLSTYASHILSSPPSLPT